VETELMLGPARYKAEPALRKEGRELLALEAADFELTLGDDEDGNA